MLTKISLWVLYVSSYIPLFFILSINNIFIYYEEFPENKSSAFFTEIIILILVLVIVISYILLKMILKLPRECSGDQFNIKRISKSNEEILSYFFAYLVPFILLNVSSIREVITFILVFIFMGIICVKNDLIYINPTLYILGYNIYTIEIDNGDKHILISKKSRKRIIKDQNINCVLLCDNIYIF